jgi:hypothetical protein
VQLGTCSADVKWSCKFDVLLVSASGESENHCRRVSFRIDESTTVSTWLYQTDRQVFQGVSNILGQTLPEPSEVTCTLWSYVKDGGPGYGDASEKPAAQAASRQSSDTDDLFDSALSGNAAPARQAAAAPAGGARPSEEGGGMSGGQLFGIIAGGVIAGRTGNTVLLDAMTGQSGSTPRGDLPVSGGNAQACQTAKSRFQTDLSAAQSRARDSKGCDLMRAAVDVWGRNRPVVAQSCAGTPGYAQMMKETDDYSANARRQLNSNACR